MREKRLHDMTDDELARVDETASEQEHDAHVPANVATDDGVIGDDVPDEAYEDDEGERA